MMNLKKYLMILCDFDLRDHTNICLITKSSCRTNTLIMYAPSEKKKYSLIAVDLMEIQLRNLFTAAQNMDTFGCLSLPKRICQKQKGV